MAPSTLGLAPQMMQSRYSYTVLPRGSPPSESRVHEIDLSKHHAGLLCAGLGWSSVLPQALSYS